MIARLRQLTPLQVVLLLFAASFIARLATFAAFGHAAYPDSIYYSSVARAILGGEGMQIDYLWAFVDVGGAIPAAPQLPLPAFAHWTPGATVIQLPFMLLLGPSDFAAALPFLLLGAAMAPLTYLLARDLFGAFGRRRATFAGILAVLSPVSAYLAQTDNFALFGVLVTATLWILARALRDGARALPMAAAGLLTAAAFLSRNDGVLLAVVVGILALADRWGAWRGARPARLGYLPLAAYYGAALLAVAPWLFRQLATFGALSPSAGSGRILWIRHYQELFGADGPLKPDYLFGWGAENLLASRVEAASYVGSTLLLVLFAAFGAIPAVLAFWRRRRGAVLQPYLVFFVVFNVWAIVVAAPHLKTGNYLHGAASLLPFGAIGVALGVRDGQLLLSRWYRRRRQGGLRPARWLTALAGAGPARLSLTALAQRVLLVMFVVIAGFGVLRVSVEWQTEYGHNQALTAWLDQHAESDDIVYAANPGAYWLLGGYHAVSTPFGEVPLLRRAASAYGADWLILERDSIVPAFEPVLNGELDLDWLSEPLFAVGDPARPDFVIYSIELSD